jgi:hypothetical protein
VRGCELRYRNLSAKTKFIAKDKREFTAYFAILQNRCYSQFFIIFLFLASREVYFPNNRLIQHMLSDSLQPKV